jgi:hypothetical protein
MDMGSKEIGGAAGAYWIAAGGVTEHAMRREHAPQQCARPTQSGARAMTRVCRRSRTKRGSMCVSVDWLIDGRLIHGGLIGRRTQAASIYTESHQIAVAVRSLWLLRDQRSA